MTFLEFQTSVSDKAAPFWGGGREGGGGGFGNFLIHLLSSSSKLSVMLICSVHMKYCRYLTENCNEWPEHFTKKATNKES